VFNVEKFFMVLPLDLNIKGRDVSSKEGWEKRRGQKGRGSEE
jgi:hypothetical protein